MSSLYRKIGSKISKSRDKKDKESSIAEKVVVVPEIRTVPVAARVTEINLGERFNSGSSEKSRQSNSFRQDRDRGNEQSSNPPQSMVPVPMPDYQTYSTKSQRMVPQSMLRDKYEAISLSDIKDKELPFVGKDEQDFSEKIQTTNENYPLISMNFKGKKVVVAWANIRWDPQADGLLYSINEPKMDKNESIQLNEIKALLRDKLDVDFTKIKISSAYKYIINNFEKITKDLGIKMDSKTKLMYQYYLFRDFVGLGEVEPLMHDKNIEDISCDGAKIPLFIYHKNPTYGQIRTNIIFNSKEELDSLVLKLAQKSGRTLTISRPLLDGALPDGSRVQATLGTDIARKGSNFTIRKFPENPMTPVDLIMYGTSSPEVLAYLWLCIENRLSVLVSGATATGKTTFLNALSLFIKPEMKVVTIEDTPELQLPLPNWIPSVARTGFGIKGYGEVSMFDLLKASLRQRPDYIVVGEIRGEEAYVMFQGMATGHPGLGTIHADNLPAVIDRLTTRPINLPMAMLENLDIMVFLMLTKRKGHYLRRISEVVEIIGYDYTMKDLVTNHSFKWDASKDEFIPMKSILMDKIRERMGLTIEELKNELSKRKRVLQWAMKNKIKGYKEFARIVAAYYSNPKTVEEMIKGGE